tara:strand:- start:398 stop:766 length:369 start_codon:yes stop_codon:yes gene_type:complete
MHWKHSHRSSLLGRPSYAIMAGTVPSVGRTVTAHRAYVQGGAAVRQGMISGKKPTEEVIPVIRGGLPEKKGLKVMCRLNLLSVNPQCSGGVGRRPFVCRSKGTSGASSGAIKQLRECSLINT